MNIKIYTDGSCNSSQIGGWAFYVPELNIRVIGKELQTTNNRMELTAVIKALEFIDNIQVRFNTIEVYSDSMYVIGGLTLNWSKEVNVDLWEKLTTLVDSFADRNLSFNHVKGHSNNVENNEVDKLAVLGGKLWTKKNS